MPFISQIEAVFVTGSLKWNRAIDEKYRVINIVSSIEFRKKNCSGFTLFLVSSSIVCRNSFESGSTAAYSQYCSSSS